ncbi:MAG: LamG domain-containing protein, partial [Chloroflexi bacterium]|nr:LamG domain-containing protein [Chloroflexota bacterium]
MQIVGYADKLSVHPGDNIKFMVSCQKSEYEAELVRLIHGDTNPDGPGYKEKVIKSPIDGTYKGKSQKLRSGSYITIPDDKALHLSGSFTLSAFIYPTTPSWRAQGILTKWSGKNNTGYGLMIDEDGSLSLWLGAKGKVAKASTGVPLRRKFWYYVAASYDAATGKVTLYQIPITIWPQDASRAIVQRDFGKVTIAHNTEPFIMASWSEGQEDGKQNIGGLYNGKIESPAIFSRAISAEEAERLRRGASPKEIGSGLLAHWDFARDFSTGKIVNAAGKSLNGVMINRPCRAMTGHNWSGGEINYKHAPQEYGAIYFHDDDLDDAQWDVAFELKVPANLKSGIYAAKVTTDGGEDYLPFFVRPPKGTATAPALFLVPTNSYLAYANIHVFKTVGLEEMGKLLTGKPWKFEYPTTDADRYMLDNKLNSLYDYHREGSGVSYSSRLRPILNMRPKYVSPLL